MKRKWSGCKSDESELNGDSSFVVTGWSSSGSKIKNCSPVGREGATSSNAVEESLLGCKNEAGESSGDAGVEGALVGDELREWKMTIVLVDVLKPEGVKGWFFFGIRANQRAGVTGRRNWVGLAKGIVQFWTGKMWVTAGLIWTGLITT